MNLFNPEIKLEKQLQAQIYNALEGDVVNYILSHAGETQNDIFLKSWKEGGSMKVTPDVMKDFYDLCMGVKRRLAFNEPVDFFIAGSPEVNANAISAFKEGNPHIVTIYSGLYNLMNQDELRYVVGHELGHLINKDGKLGRLLGFVYPNPAQMPMALAFKVRIHDQLQELVADRYGYLACGNLEACVTSVFKLSSGLDLPKLGVSMDALMERNDKSLEFFLHEGGISDDTHPVNPIRVQALKLFACARSDKELEDGMNELIQVLLKSGGNPMDPPMSIFLATAGIIAGSIDGQLTKAEYESIIANLSASHLFPSGFVENIHNEDIDKLFTESVNALIKMDGNIRPALLQYMIEIVLSDHDIHEKEVAFIYDIGQKLGLGMEEISRIFGGAIQRYFSPSLSSLA